MHFTKTNFPLAFLGLKLSPSFLSNHRREVNEEEKCKEKMLSSCRCKERTNLRFPIGAEMLRAVFLSLLSF